MKNPAVVGGEKISIVLFGQQGREAGKKLMTLGIIFYRNPFFPRTRIGFRVGLGYQIKIDIANDSTSFHRDDYGVSFIVLPETVYGVLAATILAKPNAPLA